jgi:diaminopropionate ammonia-lyase
MNDSQALAEVRLLWRDHRPTPLIELPELARLADVGRVFVKDESARPLGNFKALGGLVAGIRALSRATGIGFPALIEGSNAPRDLPRLLCASDGNHGLAVAMAAQRTGAPATVYLPAGVSGERVQRIEATGATVVSVSGTYDEAVAAAELAAPEGEGQLIPDTSSDPAHPVVRDVISGYAVITEELRVQFHEARAAPTHVFAQAGVGGLAAALAEGLEDILCTPGRMVVVEPETAACVHRALELGRAELVPGALETVATMLSCGMASAMAVQVLLRHDATAMQVSEAELEQAPAALARSGGPLGTASSAAGLAGLFKAAKDARLRKHLGLTPASSVLLVATEGRVPQADW